MATVSATGDSFPRRDSGLPGGYSSTTWFWLILAGTYLVYYFVYGLVSDGLFQGGLTAVIVATSIYLLYQIPGVKVHRIFARGNWLKSILVIVIFLACGAGYSLWRWQDFNKTWRAKYDVMIVTYAKDKNISLTKDKETGVMQVAQDQVGEWRKHYEPRIGKTPRYWDLNWQIKNWFVLWMWSAPDWILREWILKVVDRIIDALGGLYIMISEWYTRGTQ